MRQNPIKFIPLANSIGKDKLAKGGTRAPSKMINEDSELSFFTEMFYFHGTVFVDIWPQLLFGGLLVCIASFLHEVDPDGMLIGPPIGTGKFPSDAYKFHGIAGTLIGFLTVFRANLCYGRYEDGRKLIGKMCNTAREAVLVVYTYKERPDLTQEEKLRTKHLRAFIHRKVLLMWTFVRQAIREADSGFDPNSSLAKQEFNEKTFFLDPCKPAIFYNMDLNDKARYARIKPGNRPSAVTAELRQAMFDLAEISQPVGERGFMIEEFLHASCEMMEAFKGCIRIVQTPMPFPYQHMLSCVVFVFVYITPFIYANKFKYGNGWIATELLVFCFYGIQETGSKLANPFGWDDVDFDLESFGTKLAVECEEATALVTLHAMTNSYIHPTNHDSMSWDGSEYEHEDFSSIWGEYTEEHTAAAHEAVPEE